MSVCTFQTGTKTGSEAHRALTDRERKKEKVRGRADNVKIEKKIRKLASVVEAIINIT